MRSIVRAALLVSLLMPGAARAAVTISPAYAQVVAGQTLQLTASPGVTWQVDNANAGTASTGTVSKAGLFTAPTKLPKPAIATITAISNSDPSQSATATVTLLAQAPSGHTYYVSTSGSDSGDGSSGAPWRTIQHAQTKAVAGDTVLVHGGVYNEHVTFSTSGTATGYITFESAPGETAVVDGTGLDIPQNMWGLFTFSSVSYVIAQGFEIRNYTTASVKQVPIGVFVVGAGVGDQVVNNYIHDITTTAPANAKNCASDAFGMTVYGTQAPAAIDGLAVSGNEIAHTLTGCSETLSLDGNVTNFAVVSNLIHDVNNIGIGAIGFERVSKDPAYDQARDGVILGNTVYNITSFGNPDYGNQYAADGIYVDGGTNIIIDRNRIHNVDLGIELASEHKGKTSSFIVARNNIIYDGNSAGISIGGYAASKGGTDHCTVVGNTTYNNDTKNTGSGEFQIQFNATNNVVENNIFYAGSQGLLVNDFTTSQPVPAALDYNLYFSSGPTVFDWQKHKYTSFSAYQTASGDDTNSLYADPQFTDTTNLDVASTSPAVNAGDNLGAAIVGPRDFIGVKRVLGSSIDIGAYEH
jgi:Right handed beta helix region